MTTLCLSSRKFGLKSKQLLFGKSYYFCRCSIIQMTIGTAFCMYYIYEILCSILVVSRPLFKCMCQSDCSAPMRTKIRLHCIVLYSYIYKGRAQQSKEKSRKIEINMVAEKNRLRHRITYTSYKPHIAHSYSIFLHIQHTHWTWTNMFKNIAHTSRLHLQCTHSAEQTDTEQVLQYI